MKRQVCSVLVMLTLFGVGAMGDELRTVTGNVLMQALNTSSAIDAGNQVSAQKLQDLRAVEGYLLGVVDTMNILVAGNCPEQITIGQIKQATKNYLENNPEAWNAGGSAPVMLGVAHAFPCFGTKLQAWRSGH